MNTERLRVVFVTQEEATFLPSLFDEVLSHCPGVPVGAVVQFAVTQRQGMVGRIRAVFHKARRYAYFLGPWQFLRFSVRQIFAAWPITLWPRWAPPLPRSVTATFRGYGVPILRISSVNAPECLAFIRQCRPGLIVSISSLEIFRHELLTIPTYGCINLHSGKLPEYRGQWPSFWTLYNGERQGYVTVHFCRPTVDTGDIILQEAFPIGPEDTVMAIVKKAKTIGARLIGQSIELLQQGRVHPMPVPPGGSCYPFPSFRDIRTLKRKGKRVC